MKKSITFLIIIMEMWLLPFHVKAGIFDNPDKGLSVELGFSLSRIEQYHNDGGPTRDFYATGTVFTPRVGYRFNNAWEAGMMFRYDKNDVADFQGYGAFVEYSFIRVPVCNIRIFADGQYVYNHEELDHNFSEAGITPGVAVNIPTTPIDIKLRYLFIGYSNDIGMRKDVGGCLGHKGNWILDAGLRRLELSVAVNF